jgi:hypothetical protein
MIMAAPLEFADELFQPLFSELEQDHFQMPWTATNLRLQALALKIDSAVELRPNWNSYGAPCPSVESAELARRVLTLASTRSLPSTVIPSADGGIALCWDADDRHAYIEFGNDGDAVVGTYPGPTEAAVAEFVPSDSNILDAISKIQRFMS